MSELPREKGRTRMWHKVRGDGGPQATDTSHLKVDFIFEFLRHRSGGTPVRQGEVMFDAMLSHPLLVRQGQDKEKFLK